MLNEVDEQSISYQKFVECYIKGASLQDIYIDSDHGYAANQRIDTTEKITLNQLQREAKEEFTRVYEHLENIIKPIDKHFPFHGKKVLDFGCGTGSLSIAMALKGANVIGVDPAAISLEACEHRAEYFQIEKSAFSTKQVNTSPGLPFDDKSFDIVITNSVLEFIPFNRESYIHDLVRLVKPSGLLIISTENGFYPYDYYTKAILPRLRKKHMVSMNYPYGSTYFELVNWLKSNSRNIRDLNTENKFNSIDKRIENKNKQSKRNTALAIKSINYVFKKTCKLFSIPSDIFLPYNTFVFQINE